MAEQQPLDIVNELQHELGWKPDFAQEANAEYMKWLRLRAQAGDFQVCKLPPSRVVAMIWNVHRQWTLDYEQTCHKLGGFIHHFPPAMRMNIAREQAYAVTLHTYKCHFKQDPPAAYWGPSIYPYKPFTSNNDTIDPAPLRDTSSRRSLPSLRRSPVKRETARPSASGKGKTRASDNPARRNSAHVSDPVSNPPAERPRSNVDEGRPARRISKPTKEMKSTTHVPIPTEATERETDSSKKTRRTFPGSSSLYILKPLRPGEKRKRGRPSFSDYMLATGAEGIPVHEPKRRESRPSTIEKAPSPKSPAGSTHSLRRRKSAAATLRLPLTPSIKKEKSNNGPFRRGRIGTAAKSASISAAGAAVGAALPESKSNTKSTTSPTPARASSKTSTPLARASDENDRAVLIRRPRGRPRKDGSWPVPRARKADAASKAASSTPTRPTPTVTPRTQQQKRGTTEKAVENARESKREAPKPASSNSKVNVLGASPGNATGSSAPMPASKAVAPAARSPLPNKNSASPSVRKEDASAAANNDISGNGSTPSKSIDAGDISVQSLAQKGTSKAQVSHGPGHVSRGGMVDSVADQSGLADKNRPVEVSNALVGKKTQAGQDASVTHSEPTADRMDMETASGSVLCTDPSPNVNVSAVAGSGTSPSGTNKFIQNASSFQIPTVPVNPLPSPVDSGVLPLVPPAMPPKADGGGIKDVAQMDVDGGDVKVPFKRLRGRPRKDMSWPNPRSKTLGEGAAERAKDLSDPTPAPNLSMGPPGTV